MATATTDNLEEIIRLLPGYDPYEQAGECWFDKASAQYRIDFIQECCTFSMGERAGEPFVLEPWEKSIVANLYGWKQPDGWRRYRVAFVSVGRGNGKSELSAALVCSELFIDDEPGAQLYSAAGKRDQTRFVFDPVRKMIMACPEMRSRALLYKTSIVVGDRSYRAISREATTEHGGSTQFAIVDELHAHADRALIDVLETSMVKRRQPMMVCLSTSDYEREGSPCNQMHEYACKVRDNLITDESFLPAVYEATRDDDWTDPEVWKLANPNLGVTIMEDRLASLCRKAQNDPTFENEFKRLHLNIRTEQAERLLPIQWWDACRGELPDVRKRSCWCGLDLGATRDFTAFAAAFPVDGGKIAVKMIFWIPEATAAQRKEKLGTTYLVWERAGALRLTPGDEVDYGRVEHDIAEFAKEHAVREIAADRLFQAAQIVQNLWSKHGIKTYEHGQGFLSMAVPTRQFLEYVGSQQIIQEGNPVMRWMVSNLTGRQDEAGNWKPDKKRSAEKIDGPVALIMALGRAIAANKRSFYDDHPEVEFA